MHVSVAFLRAFHSVLLEMGVPQAAVYPLVEDPHAALPWDECVRRLTYTLEHNADPFLGLRMGERISVSALHVVGHLLLTSRNLREAAAQYGRFAPLVFAGAEFKLDEEGDEASYSFAPPPIDPIGEAFCADLTLTVIINVIGALLVSKQSPMRVELRHGPPPMEGVYEDAFGGHVVFNAPRNRVVFPRHVLDDTRRLGDEQLQWMLSERAERLLAQRGQGHDVVLRLRDAMRSADLETFDLTKAAQQLGLGTATLRRRLAERGTAFSQIVDDVKRDLACEALRQSRYDIKQLSARLGFSEPRAFHRAFRRWTGTTPARFRANHAEP